MFNFFGSLLHKTIVSFVGLAALFGLVSATPQTIPIIPATSNSQIAVQTTSSTSSSGTIATTRPIEKISVAPPINSVAAPSKQPQAIIVSQKQAVVSVPPEVPVATTSPTISSPSISYINPAIIIQGNSLTLTIEGSGFQSGAVLMIGGLVKLNPNDVSPNSISVNYTGSLPAGTYGVTVTNPDGGSFTLRNALAISAPETYSQPTVNYNTPMPQQTYTPQPVTFQPNTSYLNFDITAVNTSAQNLENLQKQYAQDLADMQGRGIPLEEEQGEQNNLNLAYSSQLSAAQLTLQDAQNQQKIDNAIRIASSIEAQIESEQTQNEQCSSVTLSLGEGEQGIQAEQNTMDCAASAQKEGEDIQAEAMGY